MIVLVNGAFGIGKTTVSRLLVRSLPRAILFDPELIGMALQRVTRVDDFQDLRLWRRLAILGIRAARLFRTNVIVPMAFSNLTYLDEIRGGLSRFEPRVVHVCLVAPVEVVHERLRRRGGDAWQYRRATECCAAHQRDDFEVKVLAVDREPREIVEEIVTNLRG